MFEDAHTYIQMLNDTVEQFSPSTSKANLNVSDASDQPGISKASKEAKSGHGSTHGKSSHGKLDHYNTVGSSLLGGQSATQPIVNLK